MDDEEFMLSTIDNPYNPFIQYDEWYAYDAQQGYHTPEYLARVTQSSDELSDAAQSIAFNTAMNEIIDIDILGLYIKVTKDFVPRNVQV